MILSGSRHSDLAHLGTALIGVAILNMTLGCSMRSSPDPTGTDGANTQQTDSGSDARESVTTAAAPTPERGNPDIPSQSNAASHPEVSAAPTLPDDLTSLMNRYQVSVSLLQVKVTKFDLPRYMLTVPGYKVQFELSGEDAVKSGSPYGRLVTKPLALQGVDDIVRPGEEDLVFYSDSVAANTLWIYVSGFYLAKNGPVRLFTARAGTPLVGVDWTYNPDAREFTHVDRLLVSSEIDDNVHFELELQIRLREAQVPKRSPLDALLPPFQDAPDSGSGFPIPENQMVQPRSKSQIQ